MDVVTGTGGVTAMIVLVIVACLAGEPESSYTCRGFVDARGFAVPMGCQLAAMQAAPSFEAANPGWRFHEALCVPRRRLGELLARIEGMAT
ncbi:hypothetical protein HRbin39_00460 [bacterium HR39]|nr:hypothetical protein HRbin39_00460 [bacterium HR39]